MKCSGIGLAVIALLSCAGNAFGESAWRRIEWGALPQFAESNVAIVKEPIRGIVVNHIWLGYTQFAPNAVRARPDLAEKGIVYVSPYAGPWSWMNRNSVELSDAVVDVVMRHYGLDGTNTMIVSNGTSMGGLGALIWAKSSRHRVGAVVASCPVTDLVLHYSERPDLPRTISWAFADAPDMDAAIRAHSPQHLVAQMPRIPYFIVHSTADRAVNKSMHSDRFVSAMRELGHQVDYIPSLGTGHAKLTPEATAKLNAALLGFFGE